MPSLEADQLMQKESSEGVLSNVQYEPTQPFKFRGISFANFQALIGLIDQLNVIRVELGIKDEAIASYLGICMNTYRKKKRNGYKSFTIYQIMEILRLFMQVEQANKLNNPRVQGHSKNRDFRLDFGGSQDDDDDDPHGD